MKYPEHAYGYNYWSTNVELHPLADDTLRINFGEKVLQDALKRLGANHVQFIQHVSGDSIARPDASGVLWAEKFRVKADVFAGLSTQANNDLFENGNYAIINTEDYTDHKGTKQRKGGIRIARGFLGSTATNDDEIILQNALEQDYHRE